MPHPRPPVRIVAVALFALTAAFGWLFYAVPHPSGLGGFGSAAGVDSAAALKLEQAAALKPIASPVNNGGPLPPGRLIVPSLGVNPQVLPFRATARAIAVPQHAHALGPD